MTPLIRELVALDPEVAMACVWFDMGTLPRFMFAWSELPGSRLPFEKCAIVGRDSKGDKFLVMTDQVEESTILLSAWALLADHYTRTPLFAVVMADGGCRIANVEGEDEITKDHAAPIVGILAENGNQVWVRNCVVGNASRGSVFKDYKVEIDGREPEGD